MVNWPHSNSYLNFNKINRGSQTYFDVINITLQYLLTGIGSRQCRPKDPNTQDFDSSRFTGRLKKLRAKIKSPRPSGMTVGGQPGVAHQRRVPTVNRELAAEAAFLKRHPALRLLRRGLTPRLGEAQELAAAALRTGSSEPWLALRSGTRLFAGSCFPRSEGNGTSRSCLLWPSKRPIGSREPAAC
jgi:hypothetical protein